jgi:metal-responsive CopG/Arc/MetJ family transcriptional regulator
MQKKQTSILISLPNELAASVDLALFDPVRGRTRYGARSRLIAELLRKWLKSLSEEKEKENE